MPSQKKLTQRKSSTESPSSKSEPSVSNNSEKSATATVETKRYTEFIKKFRNIAKVGEMFQFVRDSYFEFFQEHPPADKHIELIKIRLEYALIRKDYEEGGVEAPASILQNYKAGQVWDPEAFTPGMRDLLRSSLKTNKEEEMVTATKTQKGVNRVAKVAGPVAKAAFKKAVGTQESVTQSYIRMFSENAKNKYTDAQMAQRMRTLHPDKKKYTDADIAAVRGMYNRGKLSGQKGKPATESYVHEAKAK